MSMTVEQIERVSRRILYDISVKDLYRVQGKTLAESDENIKQAVEIVSAMLKAALDAEEKGGAKR